MANDEEAKANARLKQAFVDQARIKMQTNDPAQHAKAQTEIDAATNALVDLHKKSAAAIGTSAATSGPKSALDMLTGR